MSFTQKTCDKILWEDDEKDCCSRLLGRPLRGAGLCGAVIPRAEGGQHELAVVSADLRGQAEIRQHRRPETACAGEERGRDGWPRQCDRLRSEYVSGVGHDRSRQAISVSERFVGE